MASTFMTNVSMNLSLSIQRVYYIVNLSLHCMEFQLRVTIGNEDNVVALDC